MSTTTKPLPGTTHDPLYPDSDGEPMGETEFHVIAILHLYSALRKHFHRRQDVHVAADMFLYFKQGDPSACKAPDVMVTKGVVGKHMRRSFRLWEEGVAPTVVFEITSEKTRREDDIVKPAVYARLGVKEYFLFDPEGERPGPALTGFRLQGGAYEPISPDAAGRLTSQELGLALVAEGLLLRLIDLQTGARLPGLNEILDQFEEAQRAATAERERAKAERQRAEQELKRAERERQRAERERQRAERERQRAEKEREQTEAERRRADALEAELARLRGAQKPPESPA